MEYYSEDTDFVKNFLQYGCEQLKTVITHSKEASPILTWKRKAYMKSHHNKIVPFVGPKTYPALCPSNSKTVLTNLTLNPLYTRLIPYNSTPLGYERSIDFERRCSQENHHLSNNRQTFLARTRIRKQMSEKRRKRMKKLLQKREFLRLKNVIPCLAHKRTSQISEITILNEAVKHIKELEAKVLLKLQRQQQNNPQQPTFLNLLNSNFHMTNLFLTKTFPTQN